MLEERKRGQGCGDGTKKAVAVKVQKSESTEGGETGREGGVEVVAAKVERTEAAEMEERAG